jgi:3-phytase
MVTRLQSPGDLALSRDEASAGELRPYAGSDAFRVAPAIGPLQGRDARNADDPAIWIHPDDPSRSLLFLSDKKRGLYAFDLEGRLLQQVRFRSTLNNIDVRSGFRFGGEETDIVVGNLRSAGKLAVLRIDADYTDGNVLTLLAGDQSRDNDISDDSYGICLYRRADDGTMYVFDKSKSSAPIRQWEVSGAHGRIRTTEVRQIRDISMGVAEGFVADDELGVVYFTEEAVGIHKYQADPEHPVQERLSLFATGDGIAGDREGLALYACDDGSGYLLLSSQGNSTLKVYERAEPNGFVTTFVAESALGTDGLDVTSVPAPGFPHGFLVVHDEAGARYFVYDWARLAARGLRHCGASSTP